MPKTLILAINAKYVHSSLAAWVLAESVFRHAKRPHDVRVVEANINQPALHIAGEVEAHKPDVVGISVYIWNAGMLPGLLKLLRERLSAAIVLGGPEAAFNAEYWLGRGADYVLRGEGERSFPGLLDALYGGQSHPAISEGPPPDEAIDPYNEAYFAALNGRIAYIETSRGCSFACAFCLSGGSGVRFFPLDAAKEQIRKLAASGARTVKFVDRTFNCHPARAYELFEFIIGLDTSRRFHFEVAADLFDRRAIELLQTAPPGRIQLEAGLQSFYGPALEAACRQTDLPKACENIRALLRNGNIHVHVDLIAGLPHEDLCRFTDGFDRAYALGAHTLQLGFLKLLRGSALRGMETSIVHAAEPPYEIVSSPWLSVSDLNTLKQAENALGHSYNKGRFLSALGYTLSAAKLRAFDLYCGLGRAAPHRGQPLGRYAEQLYGHCATLPGVEPQTLLGHMIRDWLGMVRGNDMPGFMKSLSKTAEIRRKQVIEYAEKMLGRKIRRHEAAVLPSGAGVFADGESRDPVTGLFKTHEVEMEQICK